MSVLNGTKLRSNEAAAYLRISPSTLSKMRLRGDGPPYSLAGRRIVIYEQADLNQWLVRRRRVSTRGPTIEDQTVTRQNATHERGRR